MTTGTTQRIYLAGPMAGIPDFNFPAFHAEAAQLRAKGYEVVNPAELHEHTDQSWEFYMREALKAMLTCDSVLMLPSWTYSKGAKIEWNLAHGLGYRVYYQGEL